MRGWIRTTLAWLVSSPAKIANSDGVVFRQRNYFLALGIVSTTFFVFMGTISVIAAWTNADGSFPHPKTFAIVCGILWSIVSLLGIWLIGSYCRARLTIAQDHISLRGCFTTRSVRFDSLISAHWKIGPRVILRSPRVKIAIAFCNFMNRTEQRELIDFLRLAIPEENQLGWPDFLEKMTPRPPLTAEEREEQRVGSIRRSEYVLMKMSVTAWLLYFLSLVPVSLESLATGPVLACFGALLWSLNATALALYAAAVERHPRFLVFAAISGSLAALCSYHFVNWPVAGRYMFK